MTLDEILEAIEQLSEEERAQLRASIDGTPAQENPEDAPGEEPPAPEGNEGNDGGAPETETAPNADNDTSNNGAPEAAPVGEGAPESSAIPLEQIIRQAVAEEVKSAIAGLMKPSPEEQNPTPTSDKDKKTLSEIEAIYS